MTAKVEPPAGIDPDRWRLLDQVDRAIILGYLKWKGRNEKRPSQSAMEG